MTDHHAPPIEPASFVLGGHPFGRPTRRSATAWALILGGFLLPLPGLYRWVASTMEEGFMLVFPRRLLDGALPNRDFLHLYGPGSLDVLAAWYTLFGESLASERTYGALQLLAVVLAIATLTRPWGWRASVPAALTTTLLMITPTGLAALAWPGALAMSLWSLAFGVRSLHTDGRARTASLASGGLLAGLALAYRPDVVVALLAAWGVLVWRGRRLPLPLVAGALVGLLPMWVHLLLVGIGPAWRGMVVEPVVELRPGRRLPVPPTWGELDGALQALSENPVESPWWRVPAPPASQQLFAWFFVAVVVALAWVALAIWRWRRGPSGRVVLFATVAAFALGIIGQAVQRPDSTHLAWGSSVSLALLPVALSWGIESLGRAGAPWARVAPLAAIVALLLVTAPYFTFRPYLHAARITAGDRPGYFLVERDGRRFYLGNATVQSAAQAVVDEVAARAEPGDRLLVGPADLSRTVYSDVMFYYLLPELTPATRYIEMDPGIADAPDSGLAGEVANADWLILSNFWTGWYEPNASIEFGSTEPNEVVASDFCLVADVQDGLLLVYRRCEEGDGVDPSTIGVGPERRASMEAEAARRSGR